MNVARTSVGLVCSFALISLVIACSSSSTTHTGATGDGGAAGEGGSGDDGGGGGSTCTVAAGTYTLHSTAKDLSDGGFGCSAPPDITVTYPVAPSDAGLQGNCTIKSDSATCTTTVTCSSTQGSVMSSTNVVKTINSDGKGYTIKEIDIVILNGELSSDCEITSVATPQ